MRPDDEQSREEESDMAAAAGPSHQDGSVMAEECSEAGCCSHQKKRRSEAERKALTARLNRIEGQIRGIRGMLERDAYCIDIITQVSAASCALNSFTKELLSDHIRTCVADDIRGGNDAKLDELVKTLQKLMK